MLRSAELQAFVAATNAEAAKEFYRAVLGLELVEDTPFAVVFQSNGTILRIQIVEEVTAPAYTSLGWVVSDIFSAVKSLVAKGVTFQRYGGLAQDEHGVWESPSGAKVAWFLDPDGNTLSLTEHSK